MTGAMYDCEIISSVSNSESDLFCTESVILPGAVLLNRNFHKGGSWQHILKAAHSIRYFESRHIVPHYRITVALSQIAWRMQSPDSSKKIISLCLTSMVLGKRSSATWLCKSADSCMGNGRTSFQQGHFLSAAGNKIPNVTGLKKKRKKAKIDLSGSVWIRSAQILHIFWRGTGETSGDRKSMTL